MHFIKMNQTENIFPVYDLRNCIGAKDFAIVKVKPFEVLGWLQTPHRHEGYNISLLLQGRITKYIDFERHTIDAPAVICVGPDQINQFERAENAEMICISFSQDFLINEMRGWVACWECMFNQVILNPDEGLMNELSAYARLMLKEFKEDRSKRDLIIRNLLNAMIINIARVGSETAMVMQGDTITNKMVEQFKIYVDNHFRNIAQVAQYADMLNVTPGHLNDVIKTTVGKTAKQIIDEKRVMELKRLLFWGNYTLKEIAGIMNFEDDSYFNRFFKKHTGYTPSAFQRITREKYN
jgi:AraC-like DNA-binding protein